MEQYIEKANSNNLPAVTYKIILYYFNNMLMYVCANSVLTSIYYSVYISI